MINLNQWLFAMLLYDDILKCITKYHCVMSINNLFSRRAEVYPMIVPNHDVAWLRTMCSALIN